MQKSKLSTLPIRILFYVLGQTCVAIGVVLSVKGGLGVSTGSSVPYVVSLLNEKISVGMGTSCLMIILLLLQVIMLRGQFNPINILQFFMSILYGYLIDLCMAAMSWLNATTYPGRLLLVVLSAVLQGFGICVYVGTKLISMPPEGFCLALCAKIEKLDLGKAKICLDIGLVVLSAALGLIFLRQIVGIREGTLVLALGTGNVIRFFQKRLNEPLKNLYFGKEAS